MRQLTTKQQVNYAQPYMPLGEPFACKLQLSTTSIILSTLLAGGVGYAVQKYHTKVPMLSTQYNKLPTILKDLLPFATALAIGLPMYGVRAVSKSSCQKGLKNQISQLQM